MAYVYIIYFFCDKVTILTHENIFMDYQNAYTKTQVCIQSTQICMQM